MAIKSRGPIDDIAIGRVRRALHEAEEGYVRLLQCLYPDADHSQVVRQLNEARQDLARYPEDGTEEKSQRFEQEFTVLLKCYYPKIPYFTITRIFKMVKVAISGALNRD